VFQLHDEEKNEDKKNKKIKEIVRSFEKTQNNIRRLSRINPTYFEDDTKPMLVQAFFGRKRDDGKTGFGHPLDIDGKSYLDQNKFTGGVNLSKLIIGAKSDAFIWRRASTSPNTIDIKAEKDRIKKELPYFMKMKKKGTETYLMRRWDGTQKIYHYQTDGEEIAKRYKELGALLQLETK
jgi:hypothetical protein